MDKGAHFYKCDFQVHTPRDANWVGQDAVSPSERKQYAEELIRSCRLKGLGAIAITDHHDLAFFPYVRDAAELELDDMGVPVLAAKRIVVFPGIELTLTAPNCQAILILDSDFPDNLLPSVLTALSITAAPPGESKCKNPVERIPQNVVNDLTDLYDKLNSHQQFRGRFAVLPNVSEGGQSTILRSGFANFYKSMPCVGGYVDGSVSQFGQGNQSIVSGKNRDYGFKSIGVFQTSDNRRRDHHDLAEDATWVKWAKPTAEALRQACLAKESRMSQVEPEVPSFWITALSISNSKFLSRVDLDLNQQYNALIGGRGTGKSTLLEYLRWGLCDQPVDYEDAEVSSVQSKRKRLIDDTLRKYDGEVHVTFMLNAIRHVVKRSSKTQTILLKIGEGDFVQTTEEEIRNLLPIQAYSQKQLSSVGIRIEELKRFIEVPIRKAVDQIHSDIRDTAAKMRIAYGNLTRKRNIETEINKYKIEIDSLTAQIEGLRASLKGLSTEDQATINQKAKYDEEEQIISTLNGEMERVRTLVDSTKSEMEGYPSIETEQLSGLGNSELIGQIHGEFRAVFQRAYAHIETIAKDLSVASLASLNEKIRDWKILKDDFDLKYEIAKASAQVNHQQLNQIQVSEKRIAELKKLQSDNRGLITALGDPEKTYKGLKDVWYDAHKKKIEMLRAQCEKFSGLSSGFIKAEITKSLDVETLKQRLKVAFTGMNIKEQKIDDLCQCALIAEDPMATWNSTLGEIESLAHHKSDKTEPLPVTPVITGCGYIETERTRMVSLLTPEKWLELSIVELEFNPVFRYCTNKDTREYIDFADASAGQQATALLTVLLNEQGAPLIIDQPEDDIDSKLVKTIIEQIWQAKTKRQIIFASHNANFVVNGDAELVAVCDYIKSGDQTGGRIKNAGAIDIAEIRSEITTVTEGGEEAFKLRMEKYGF